MQPHIVFIDSGVGGLPYLRRTRELLPDGRFSYVADPGNFPYGEKKAESLIPVLVSNIDRIQQSLFPDIVVLACNTASVVGLKELRSRFSLPFVGVVPAVKPAAVLSARKRIGILATRETVGNPYTQKLIDTFATGTSVFRFAGIDIVDVIEHRFFTISEADKTAVLTPAARYFIDNDVDAVVLGCTHFLHIKEELQNLLGPNIQIVDSVEGVAKQIVNVAGSLDSTREETEPAPGFYTATAPAADSQLRRFADAFTLPYTGGLP